MVRMAGPVRRSARRRLLQGLIGLGVGTMTGAGAWGYFYERHGLRVTRAHVPVHGLPDALHGLRIGLLTDTHRSDTVPETLVREAVRLAREASPDLIVLGGDYVTWGDRKFVGPAAEALSGLTAPLGVFAVLGNHDDDRDMPAALTRQGYTVLRDARTAVTARGETIDVAGVRYWTRKPADVERVLRGKRAFTMLLAHDPRRLFEAAALDVPLVLSGHTHGGQIFVPGVGALAKRRFPVLAGLGQRNDTTLFVSRGIGTVYLPVRINCPPEVAILTLVQVSGERAAVDSSG
jgi:predicted MPP superfamily phosphohydrolase